MQLLAVSRDQWPDRFTSAPDPAWWLQFDRGRLALLRAGDREGVSVPVADIQRRAVRQSELAKACGLATGGRPTVLDGTGGWGLDALCLARLGASVTIVERLPPMWALIRDLLECSGATDVALHCADLWEWLPRQSQRFDVIYLDPMFAPRKKSAAPNKRLQYLADLVRALEPLATAAGNTDPVQETQRWLQQCRQVASKRIVIKRRRHDPPLAVAPTWQIKGRSVRYDVFDPGQLPATF
ncbi:MAG: class I SAM-dependent methyltransferase [Pseudomonadales bacterium]